MPPIIVKTVTGILRISRLWNFVEPGRNADAAAPGRQRRPVPGAPMAVLPVLMIQGVDNEAQ